MKISVFWHHVQEAARQTGRSLPSILEEIRLIGISAVECDIHDTKAPGFADLITAAGLGVSSIYAFFEFGQNPAPQAALDLLETAARLKAPQVMVIPGFIRDGSTPGSPAWEAQVSHMILATAGICALARPLGVRVSMEDFDDQLSPIATHKQLKGFFDAIPELTCSFDTGNFRYSAVDELEAFALLKDRISHVHCKDRSLVPVPGGEAKTAVDGTVMYPAAVGSGVIALAAIVDELLARNYPGYFCIEHFGAPDYLAYMHKSAAWLLSR